MKSPCALCAIISGMGEHISLCPMHVCWHGSPAYRKGVMYGFLEEHLTVA